MTIRYFYILISYLFCLNILAEDDFRIDAKTSRALPTFSGKIILTKGRVVKIPKDREYERAIKVGSKVYVGEKVVTGKSSLLKMRMVDDSIITLGPNSKLLISKFDYITKDKRSAVYTLLKGKLRGHIKRKVPKEHSMTVETRQAAMGIRGTEVLANLTINKKLKLVTQMALLSGEAEVLNKIKKTKKILKIRDQVLLAGSETVIDYDKLLQLSDKEFKELTSPSFKEDDTFPAMLNYQTPYLTSTHFDKSRGSKALNGENGHGTSRNGNWQKNLKKLNKKLKENSEL